MAKLTRFTQKVFGSNAGLNQIAQFGSLANGTPTFTTNPGTIQSLAIFLEGWFNAIIGSENPAIEDMNALFYLIAYQLAYIMQEGIAEWDSGTTYYTGSIVQDSTGVPYVSLTDSNLNNAVTDYTKWNPLVAMSTNASTQNVIVTSGKSYFQPNFNIQSGATWTVNSGGTLSSIGPSKVNGTLVVNGLARIL